MLASEISRSITLDEIIHKDGSACLAAFIKSLEDSPDCDIETFLAARPAQDRSELALLVAIELRHRLSKDRSYRIEQYLKRFPELGKDKENLLDLIYAEYYERRRHDPDMESQEYYQRFPNLRDSLERLFRVDELLLGEPLSGDLARHSSAILPAEGDKFLDFRLKSELGRGTFGRVFLAEQETLSDRRVVLKISPRRTIEHRTMARLEHSNIVPILSAHWDEERGLQAVCMPYQYAVALSDVHEEWTDATLQANRADVYLQSVMELVPAELLPKRADREMLPFPKRHDFVYATAWIMHKLAGALDHAHLRGIYHRDLKPSNILLSVTGHPLLVDFNLSFDKLESAGSDGRMIGGTLAYMPPEQIQALHPIEQGRVDDVGPRADIFSLAVTAFELLTGRLPFGAPKQGTDSLAALLSQLAKRYTEVPNVCEYNPLVPTDFAALLAKCLDPIPHRRYDTAAQLAQDLDRFLQDRPLRHIAMISLRARARKFVRRNRRRLIAGTATAAAICAASFFVAHSYHEATTERRAREKTEILASQLQTTADKEADAALARRLKDPDDGKNFYRAFLMGREFFTARQYGMAIRCLDRSLELNSDYSPAYLSRGRCFANLDKDTDALRDYSAAILLDRNDIYSLLARAICYATSETHADSTKSLADVERACGLLNEGSDEHTSVIHLEIARVFSAVSTLLKNADDRERVLQCAEENIIRAFDLGVKPSYVQGYRARDRVHALEAVLSRPNVQRLMRDGELTETIRE